MSTVTIRPVGSRDSVTGDLDGDDTISGGVGGWEERQRPRRSATVSWTGTPGVTWQVPVILGPGADRSVERECQLLQQWGVPAADDDQPPVLLVAAPAGRAAADAKWVLQDIDWGEQTRDTNDVRVQQEVSLTFLQYVPGQVLKGPAARSRENNRHKWVPISAKDQRCKRCKQPRKSARHTNRGGD